MFQAMTAPQQASLQSLNLQFSTKRARGTGRRGLHFLPLFSTQRSRVIGSFRANKNSSQGAQPLLGRAGQDPSRHHGDWLVIEETLRTLSVI